MKRPLQTGLWIGYVGMMIVAGWTLGALRSEAPDPRSEPGHPTKSESRTSAASESFNTLPLLHERIDAAFGHWWNPETAPTLDEKLLELDAFRSIELEELGIAMLTTEPADDNVDELVGRLLERIKDGDSQSYEASEALRGLMEQISERDPDHAWEILNSFPNDLLDDYDPFCESLLIARLKIDPDSVFNHVTNKYSHYSSQREWLWELIATELASVDLPRAREALAHMPGDHGRAISAVAAQWARSDPEAAVRWASRFSDFHPNPAVSVLANWLERDPHAALALESKYSIGTLSGEMSVREQLASQWARIDSESALDWGLGEDGSGYLREVVSGVRNPSRMLQLARAHSADAELQIAPHLAEDYAQTDPGEALAWLRALPDHSEANLARMRALNGMGFSDAATREFARLHFAELWHPEIDITIIGRGYHYDQQGIASGILKLFADDPNRLIEVVDEARAAKPREFDNLMHEVAELDFEATANYLLARPDYVRTSTVKRILKNWEEQDPGAASAFAEKHKESLQQADSE